MARKITAFFVENFKHEHELQSSICKEVVNYHSKWIGFLENFLLKALLVYYLSYYVALSETFVV